MMWFMMRKDPHASDARHNETALNRLRYEVEQLRANLPTGQAGKPTGQ